MREAVLRKQDGAVAPFYFLVLPSTAAEQHACASAWVATQYAAPQAQAKARPLVAMPRSPSGQLSLAYVSSDFRDHATSYLLADIFERHDRASFMISAYSLGPDDHSAMRERIQHGVDRFVDMYGVPSSIIADRMRADGVDILLDLNGYVQWHRPEIFAYRPAPVQVNYLGYPGTTGAPYMDYIIVDRFVVPPSHAHHFSERLAYLPDCYQPNDRPRPIAADTPSRAACGLPEHGFVFCAFNQAYKITPAVFALWMRLLAATPGSVLWLLETHAEASANLRAAAASAGIDPQRLVFAPRLALPAHLARHRLADLFLDTLPVNGHTTTSDALWAGLPVLTCAGETFVSRVAGSLLHAVGLPELVTSSLARLRGPGPRPGPRPRAPGRPAPAAGRQSGDHPALRFRPLYAQPGGALPAHVGRLRPPARQSSRAGADFRLTGTRG